MSSIGRFLHLCQQAGVREEIARGIWDSLYSRYSEPHRHYHNLRHIEAMLAKMDEVSPGDVAMEQAICSKNRGAPVPNRKSRRAAGY